MSDVMIRVENLSKEYRLGTIGGGTVRADLSKWWAKRRGLPDPMLKIGESDHGNRDGEQIWALQDVSFAVKITLCHSTRPRHSLQKSQQKMQDYCKLQSVKFMI